MLAHDVYNDVVFTGLLCSGYHETQGHDVIDLAPALCT